MESNETLRLPPVIKHVEVACPPARAFALFTAEIHVWWPMATHSLAAAETEHVGIEPRVGGRVFERAKGGTEADWGTVLEWSPPDRIRFTWRVGKAAQSHQEVEVRFEPSARGTIVTLIHSGFVVVETRQSYDGGWGAVLGEFASAGGATGTPR